MHVLLGVFFVIPLTLLLIIHSKNFGANQTTLKRMGSNLLVKAGAAPQEVSNREYAEQALLNYQDKDFIFKNY